LSSIPVYSHHGRGPLAILSLLLMIVVAFLFVGVAEAAFVQIGITRLEFVAILIATFLGSFVNIPVWKVRGVQRFYEFEETRIFWLTYRIPHIRVRQTSTLIAVNFGGAIVPVLVSIYLLSTHLSELPYALVAIPIAAFIINRVAKGVRGVGIVTPFLLPPIVAALISFILIPSSPSVLAYVSGTLGALIGADLANLNKLSNLGAPVASIGGAGTFDGVFLTGIIAVILLSIF
jgi:uncharacterized membrane protein